MSANNGVSCDIKESALDLIGNTPLLALDRLYPGPGRLLAKCEFMSPGASVKCRASMHMIISARKSGALKPGGAVVEVTSGNQGTGLAVVCAVLGHPLTIVMSKGNSIQRAIHMRALGAEVVLVPQVEGSYGQVTHADIDAARVVAVELVEKTGAYFVNQLSNEKNSEAHYLTTGREIWEQTGHQVNAFVAAVGTAGTFTGASRYLREKNPEIKCYAVEPEGSEPLKGCKVVKPKHFAQGTGYGIVPTLFEYENLERTISVTDEEVVKYKDLIGEKEGLFVGYSSGSNVAAAIKLLKSGELPPNATVVTILCDTGLKYTDSERTITVSDKGVLEYKKLIGEKEGLYVGYSSGSNVVAAIKLLESGELPEDACVVTILCDSGLKSQIHRHSLVNDQQCCRGRSLLRYFVKL